MFVGRLAGMVGFRTHTFTRIGSIMDKNNPVVQNLPGCCLCYSRTSKNPQYFHLQQNAHQT